MKGCSQFHSPQVLHSLLVAQPPPRVLFLQEVWGNKALCREGVEGAVQTVMVWEERVAGEVLHVLGGQ